MGAETNLCANLLMCLCADLCSVRRGGNSRWGVWI